ncbi:helix-turn-helix domain-containing protein [Streptomyces sp. NPDC127074]|uniref:helix-turn-helix domain-containing protein n=1 Tax=Streptomyces sp. NPDC127074 TaxID=3347130 RepID=UPI0036600843
MKTYDTCVDSRGTRVLDLGQVRISVLKPLAPAREREYRTFLQPNPGNWLIVLSFHQEPSPFQGREGTHQAATAFVLREETQPLDLSLLDREKPEQAVVVQLPRSAVPIPSCASRNLTRGPVPLRNGPGVVLARFLEGVADQCAMLESAPVGRLGSAVIDLSAMFLTSMMERREVISPSPKTELIKEIKRFVIQHLNEPRLSPALIAAEHHISLRYLQHLFQQDQRTVRGFIRQERLERCRADLADASHARRTVGEIRARWGFQDDAVFGRVFKKTYGVSPGEYRKGRIQGPGSRATVVGRAAAPPHLGAAAPSKHSLPG